ncbi:MAG: hypothetical protein V2I33_16385 [Kangiellaceae bacterium]|jgi:hypothetical protein|nr:hypothetical protein [Kangiellaceae bacterium]
MPTSIMVTTPEMQKEVDALIKRAEENIIPIETTKAMADGTHPPVGDEEHCSLTLDNLRVVYSLEEQLNGYVYKHMSVSKRGGELPNHADITFMLITFKFKHFSPAAKPSEDFLLWKEKVGPVTAINIIERTDIKNKGAKSEE